MNRMNFAKNFNPLVTFSSDDDDDYFARLFDEADDDVEEEEEELDVDLEKDPGEDTGSEDTGVNVEEEEDPEKEEDVQTPDGEQQEGQETDKSVEQEEETEEEEEEIPPTPEVDPEKQKQEIEKFSSELQKLYAISEEDADAILTDPAAVLPRLMANANMIMLKQVGQMMQQFQQNLPNVINQTMVQKSAETERVDALKKAYPELMTDEAVPYVVQAVNTIRQSNPKIKFDALIKKVGPVAHALMGTMPVVKQEQEPAKVPPKPVPRHIQARESSVTPPAKKLSPDEEFYSNLIQGDI